MLAICGPQVERYRRAAAQAGIGIAHQSGARLVGQLIELLLHRGGIGDQAAHHAVVELDLPRR